MPAMDKDLKTVTEELDCALKSVLGEGHSHELTLYRREFAYDIYYAMFPWETRPTEVHKLQTVDYNTFAHDATEANKGFTVWATGVQADMLQAIEDRSSDSTTTQEMVEIGGRVAKLTKAQLALAKHLNMAAYIPGQPNDGDSETKTRQLQFYRNT